MLGAAVDAGIQQAVLVEEGRVDFAVALGEASQGAGDKATELLGLGESLHLGASWAAVATAHLAESVPLHPALCKLADAGSWQAQGQLQVIIGVTVVATTQALRAILQAPWQRDGQEGPPVVYHLQAEVRLQDHMEAEREDAHLAVAQLQG